MLVPAIIVDAAAKASASSIDKAGWWCCNPGMGRADRGNALKNARVWHLYVDLLEGDHNESGCRGRLGQLIGPQEEIRVGGAAPELLMAPREGLVDQQAVWRDRGAYVAQDRPPEIVRDDHGTELPVSQRERRASFQVSRDGLHARPRREVAQSRNVPIDCGDREPVLKRQPHVPTRPAGDVQHPFPGWCAGNEMCHPGRGRGVSRSLGMGYGHCLGARAF